MDNEAFTTEIDEARHIATIRLAREAAGNRLFPPEIRALGRAISELGGRAEVKAVLLRAGGEHFCLGRQPFAAGSAPVTALAIRSAIAEPILDLFAAVRATPVPVIAVVQGDAKAFGCALVAQCDIVIAADSARFALPEMDHNIPPTLAMSALLGKMPPKRLMHFVYTRSELGAAEALSLGLLSEVVPLLELEAAVGRTLSRLVDRERAALAAVKEFVLMASHLDAASAARLAANLLSVVHSSPEKK